ncbi:MAG: hypothetical protein FVQ85_16855 [Planctomycetes bacterium]|nr:hypothetical protein [Planctomycetota bacterium]
MFKQKDMRSTKSEVMKTKYVVIGLSVVFGLAVWVIDAALDSFFFYEGTFWELLIADIPKHEIYIRLIILAFFIVFGILMAEDIARRKRAEEQLRAANQQLQASEQQLRAANQQLQASEQQLKAANQQLRAGEEELRKLTHDMGERIKELNCLYGLSLLIEQRDIALEEIFQGLLELIPPGWHYPEITCARVIFEGREFKTANFKKTIWEQSADIKVSGRKVGAIEIYYLKECPILDEGPFLKEERNLIDGISRALDEAILYKQAEEARRAANQQLQASGQQLRAANQQLSANGQQLRAANQQLQASEQQLRAANQQLKASEQQLRAANQQLNASGQQLRAANQQLQAEVAERMRDEDIIKESLKEKEVLLKEIHHRVKNNLQVISSILNLQSKYIEDEGAKKVFRDGQSRVRSMALVHEKLCEAEDLAKIDFTEYIRSMTGDLFRLHGISQAISSKIDVKDVFLDINTAIPCGLIINELVSNALKYAFPDEREGEICIGLYPDKDGRFSLVIKDNGIGFPKDLDFRKTESLGMQLVIMLVEQIGGTIELERKEGAVFTITFEELKSGDGEVIK